MLPRLTRSTRDVYLESRHICQPDHGGDHAISGTHESLCFGSNGADPDDKPSTGRFCFILCRCMGTGEPPVLAWPPPPADRCRHDIPRRTTARTGQTRPRRRRTATQRHPGPRRGGDTAPHESTRRGGYRVRQGRKALTPDGRCLQPCARGREGESATRRRRAA